MLLTFLKFLFLVSVRCTKKFLNPTGEKGIYGQNQTRFFAGFGAAAVGWLHGCANRARGAADWCRGHWSCRHHRHGHGGWLRRCCDDRGLGSDHRVRPAQEVHQKRRVLIRRVLLAMAVCCGQQAAYALPACTFAAVCAGFPTAIEEDSYAQSGFYYCMERVGGQLGTVNAAECGDTCTNQANVGVRYLKITEIGQHPDTVGADSTVAAAVSAAFNAFTDAPNTCDAGCLHQGIPDPDDFSGVYYKDPPLPGPQYELFRGFLFDRTNVPCTGPGDAGTLNQETVGRSELSKPGDGSGPGGGTGGATKIDEAGTPTGDGAYASADQAENIFSQMTEWLGSVDFVPTLPWSFEWSLPATVCVDPSITWLGQTGTWGVCSHPALDHFRNLWAWAFAMLAAFRIWSLAVNANS